MDVIVSCSMRTSWCEFAQKRLMQMGLGEPKRSQRTFMHVNDLLEKMATVQKSYAGKSKNASEGSLGRTWEIASADLFLANADQELWGFASPLNLGLLNFWRDFEPQAKFLLIFGSLSEGLADVMTDVPLTHGQIEAEVQSWIDYHNAMLSFYNENQDRCLLVSIQKFEGNAVSVSDSIHAKFGFPVDALTQGEERLRSPLHELVASHCGKDFQSAEELYGELVRDSDLPIVRSNTNSTLLGSKAAHQLFDLKIKQSENDEFRKQNEGLAARVKTLESELEKSQLDTSKEQELNQKIVVLKSRISELEDELTQALKRTDEATIPFGTDPVPDYSSTNQGVEVHSADERSFLNGSAGDSNDSEAHFLRQQLRQVQEELEYYFGEYQALKNADAVSEQDATNESSTLTLDAQDAVTLDLCSYIDGDGWHSAEPHGRWAGAAARSSITLPNLEKKAYKLRLKIVDSISLRHLNNVDLKLNGEPLTSNLRILSDMGGNLAPLRRLKAKYQNIPKPFPAEIVAEIPSAIISQGGEGQLLEILTPNPAPPEGAGQSDSRNLSICVKSLEIS